MKIVALHLYTHTLNIIYNLWILFSLTQTNNIAPFTSFFLQPSISPMILNSSDFTFYKRFKLQWLPQLVNNLCFFYNYL